MSTKFMILQVIASAEDNFLRDEVLSTRVCLPYERTKTMGTRKKPHLEWRYGKVAGELFAPFRMFMEKGLNPDHLHVPAGRSMLCRLEDLLIRGKGGMAMNISGGRSKWLVQAMMV